MTGLLEERKTMTLEEFLALPELDENGNHFELDEGELITLSPVGRTHGRRVTKISSYLDRALDEAIYEVVCGEVGILMALDPKATVRGMDVAVLRKTEHPEKGMVRSAPFLIVEVISPSNNPVDLEKKRKQYQEFGVEEVWFVYEDFKCLYVYRRQQGTVAIHECPAQFESSLDGLMVDTRELFR